MLWAPLDQEQQTERGNFSMESEKLPAPEGQAASGTRGEDSSLRCKPVQGTISPKYKFLSIDIAKNKAVLQLVSSQETGKDLWRNPNPAVKFPLS